MQHSKPKTQPESLASIKIIKYMKARSWACWKVGAGKYVSGWPDYYCVHHIFKHRWIEIKVDKNKLRASQVKRFRELTKAGDEVFVLENEGQYGKLFKPPNWEEYIRGIL